MPGLAYSVYKGEQPVSEQPASEQSVTSCDSQTDEVGNQGKLYSLVLMILFDIVEVFENVLVDIVGKINRHGRRTVICC
jgi:hypothetical protein